MLEFFMLILQIFIGAIVVTAVMGGITFFLFYITGALHRDGLAPKWWHRKMEKKYPQKENSLKQPYRLAFQLFKDASLKPYCNDYRQEFFQIETNDAQKEADIISDILVKDSMKGFSVELILCPKKDKKRYWIVSHNEYAK